MRPPGVKLYRKVRYRKGFGIHSPFVYNLITKVVEEKLAYYSFEEIEKFRKQLLTQNDLIGRITKKETQPANFGAFLFRIMNFFKCESVLHIGCSTGVIGLYLAMASPGKSTCYLLEERVGLLQSVRDFAVAHHLNNIQMIEGKYEESISKILQERKEIDLIFMDYIDRTTNREELMLLCRPLIKKKTILILNGIKNKPMKEVWKTMKESLHSSISLDLYSTGVVFFDEKLPKKNYKVYFNHGKKQNIYEDGRRRLHFFGWRKKGTKNKPSN